MICNGFPINDFYSDSVLISVACTLRAFLTVYLSLCPSYLVGRSKGVHKTQKMFFYMLGACSVI